jgi:predicted nucleic acid-binding protein
MRETRARLEAKAMVVAEMDLLIAAQAIAAHAVLVAHDRVFQKMEGLAPTAEWAADLAQKQNRS